MNKKLVKALEIITTEAEVSVLGDDHSDLHVKKVLAAIEFVRKVYESHWDKPEPSPKFKAWDYVHHVRNKECDRFEDRLHIFGTVIKQENNNVWLTDDNDTCEIIRVFEEDLDFAEAPKYGWNYTTEESYLARKFEKGATTHLSLYPHSSSDEEAIRWRSYFRKASDNDYPILRECVGTNHYHYYIRELGVFCSENYS